MLDYEDVKRFYAEKLVEDLRGHGRMESAFFHTCVYAFERGLTEQANDHAEAMNSVYRERAQCVALIASMALTMGHKAGVVWDTFANAWHIVYVDLPTGQVSWHFSEADAGLFAHLPTYDGVWDGHSTEEKYMRVSEQAKRIAVNVKGMLK